MRIWKEHFVPLVVNGVRVKKQFVSATVKYARYRRTTRTFSIQESESKKCAVTKNVALRKSSATDMRGLFVLRLLLDEVLEEELDFLACFELL